MFAAIIYGEKNIEIKFEKLVRNHRLLAMFAVFLGMPICILLAVSALTTVAILPIAWLAGWL
ncbi:MAG: hypothetical protein RR846_06115 [Oscillospiraceae bacterium]